MCPQPRVECALKRGSGIFTPQKFYFLTSKSLMSSPCPGLVSRTAHYPSIPSALGRQSWRSPPFAPLPSWPPSTKRLVSPPPSSFPRCSLMAAVAGFPTSLPHTCHLTCKTWPQPALLDRKGASSPTSPQPSHLGQGEGTLPSEATSFTFFGSFDVAMLSPVQLFFDPMDCSPQAPSQAVIRSGLPFSTPGIFPIQGSNLRLLRCRRILYHWATWEAPWMSYRMSDTLDFSDCFLRPNYVLLLGSSTRRAPTVTSVPETPDYLQPCVLFPGLSFMFGPLQHISTSTCTSCHWGWKG